MWLSVVHVVVLVVNAIGTRRIFLVHGLHVVVLVVNAFGTRRVFLVLCLLSSRASLVVRVLRHRIKIKWEQFTSSAL